MPAFVPAMPAMNSSKIRRSRAEADRPSGWNWVPRANQFVGALDGLDDAVGAAGGDGEAGRHLVDRHVVHAVDADFALAVDPLHQRAHLDLQGVAMVGVHRVAVRQRRGRSSGMCRNRLPPCDDVQQLHADADAEHRHPAMDDHAHQPAVEFLAAPIQQPHRGMEHEAVATRIEIGAADHDHRVEHVENPGEIARRSR